MDPCVKFQSQIADIMDVLTKAAVAEISKLLVIESELALRVEMKRRDAETEKLLQRLRAAETELQRVKSSCKPRARSHTCSVGVQVETSRGTNDVFSYGGTFLTANHFCSDAPPPLIQCKEADDSDEDLEFQMKIEQVDKVEEEEEEKHFPNNHTSAEQNFHNTEYNSIENRSSQLWLSAAETENGDGETLGESEYYSGFEQQRKNFLTQGKQFAAAQVLTEDGSCSFTNKMNTEVCGSNSVKGVAHEEGISGINGTCPTPQTLRCATKQRNDTQTSQKSKGKRCSGSNVGSHSSASMQSLATPSTQLNLEVRKQCGNAFKIYPCGECGKRFTQRKRLVSHQWVHTGERPFRCRICGKMFSRQDNCHRHERLHSL